MATQKLWAHPTNSSWVLQLIDKVGKKRKIWSFWSKRQVRQFWPSSNHDRSPKISSHQHLSNLFHVVFRCKLQTRGQNVPPVWFQGTFLSSKMAPGKLFAVNDMAQVERSSKLYPKKRDLIKEFTTTFRCNMGFRFGTEVIYKYLTHLTGFSKTWPSTKLPERRPQIPVRQKHWAPHSFLHHAVGSLGFPPPKLPHLEPPKPMAFDFWSFRALKVVICCIMSHVITILTAKKKGDRCKSAFWRISDIKGLVPWPAHTFSQTCPSPNTQPPRFFGHRNNVRMRPKVGSPQWPPPAFASPLWTKYRKMSKITQKNYNHNNCIRFFLVFFPKRIVCPNLQLFHLIWRHPTWDRSDRRKNGALRTNSVQRCGAVPCRKNWEAEMSVTHLFGATHKEVGNYDSKNYSDDLTVQISIYAFKFFSSQPRCLARKTGRQPTHPSPDLQLWFSFKEIHCSNP